jgi:apolipoprotein N-acyltransferase
MSELSFPWLTLGNTQTYDLAIVQIASVTGVYGISFWILLLNVLIFLLFVKISSRAWKPGSGKAVMFSCVIIVVYLLPKIYGHVVLNSPDEQSENIIRIAVIQPNIDPFEKWLDEPERPLAVIAQQTNELEGKQIDLIIWPETAIPFYILHPADGYKLAQLRQQVDRLNASLLAGVPDIYYYREGEVIPKTSKISINGDRYDTFNSSMLIQPKQHKIQKYAKNILVPFAERVPFSEALSFLNAMQWNFGLGGWAHGRDTVIFSFTTIAGDSCTFSNMICYESVFPGLVSAFVRKGAQFLTIITNDSWWGNTSGAYQHKQFAVLRAVENRRWVVQGTNGGISCFINPYGRIISETKMYEQATLINKVEPGEEITFYTRYGDWFAELCLAISIMMLASGFGQNVYSKIRKRQLNGIY